MPILRPELEQTPEELRRAAEEALRGNMLHRIFNTVNDTDTYQDAINKTPNPPQEQTPEQMGRDLSNQNPLNRLMQGLSGQGQSHAKPLGAPSQNNWHPPQVMPNTPRDPEKERREAEVMKKFLAGGGGPGYGLAKKKDPMSSVHPSQNPFSKPTASPGDMSRAAGAVMRSQIPKAPVPNVQRAAAKDTPYITDMSELTPYGPGQPRQRNDDQSAALPQVSRLGAGFNEFSQDYGTDEDLSEDPFVGIEDGGGQRSPDQFPELSQDYGMDEDLSEDPFVGIEEHGRQRSPYEEQMMEMMRGQTSPDGIRDERMSQRGLDDRLSQISGQNADLGFMKLLMRNANQFGQVDGKVASSAPFDELIGDMQKQNSHAGDQMVKTDAASKGAKDERLKAIQFMIQQDNLAREKGLDREIKREGFGIQKLGFENASNDRNALIAATVGRDANNFALGKNKLTLEQQKAAQQAEKDAADAAIKLQQATTAAQQKAAELQLKEAEARLSAANDSLKNSREDKKLGLDAQNIKSQMLLDQQKLKREQWEMNNLAQGLDKDGKKIKTKVQERQENNAADVYESWIQNGGKANVEQNIEKLKAVKAAILNDKMASGPVLGWVPESIQTFGGMKGPTYKSDVEDAISSTFKETLGGNFTLTEGEGLKKNAYDPKQTPEENARRVQRVIDKMEAGKAAKDRTVKYLDENGGIQMPGSSAPAGRQSAPQMVKIQAPDGSVREVPASSAQKYLSKGGKLVQ